MVETGGRYIATRVVFDIASGAVLVREDGWYEGPVAECKGASPEQENLEKQQADFASTLASNYSKQFGQQTVITQGLQAALQPVINAGPSQYGYSNAEDAALRTQASAGTSGAFRSAKQSLGENQAASGGGDEFLGSGVKSQENAQLATSAAQTESGQQLDITKSGFDTGRAQFNNAVGESNQLAGVINPDGTAGQATGAGASAANDEDEIVKENTAASPWGAIGGILGGAAGAFAGPLGSSLGSAVGKSFSSSPSTSGSVVPWDPSMGA